MAVEQGRLDAGGATALDHDAIGPAARVEPGAGGGGRGQVGQVHRLLGVARTPEGALAAPVAAVDVAEDRRAAKAERLDAAIEELGVPPDDLPGHGADRDGPLDLVEVGRHGARVGVLHALVGLPGTQHPVRRAEAGAGVDDRGAADTLAERQGDGGTPEGEGGAAAAVKTLHALHRRTVEIVLREVGALLEHEHAKTGACQLMRHDGAARTGADDACIDGLVDVPLDVRILERCQARATAGRVGVEAVVSVAERRGARLSAQVSIQAVRASGDSRLKGRRCRDASGLASQARRRTRSWRRALAGRRSIQAVARSPSPTSAAPSAKSPPRGMIASATLVRVRTSPRVTARPYHGRLQLTPSNSHD